MNDIQAIVLADAASRVGKPVPLSGADTSGRYASRVRVINTPEQPTSFAGKTGVVARIVGDTAFVRIYLGRTETTLPFGISSLEVIR